MTGCTLSWLQLGVVRRFAALPPAPRPALQLDWRRALGVHLWYGCQPTATVAEALASYTAAVEAGTAPPPLPLYAEQAADGAGGAAGASSAAAAASGGSFDVAFELLRLHAVGSDPDAAGSAAALQPLLARLLRCGEGAGSTFLGFACWPLCASSSACLRAASPTPEAAPQHAPSCTALSPAHHTGPPA